jgi:hypothetical protein
MQALGLNNATIEFTLSATEPSDVIYLTENDATRVGIVPSPVTASLHLPCASEGTEERAAETIVTALALPDCCVK